MTKHPNAQFYPAGYLARFSEEEFRFRWLEALSEDDSEWRTRADDHLARTLNSFMNQHGTCHPGIKLLARYMVVSASTIRRSTRSLVEAGWLVVVPRSQDTNVYQATLPSYGLELLLKKREAQDLREAPQEWKAAVEWVVSQCKARLGITSGSWESSPEMARLEGRLFQVIQRLGGPSASLDHLVRVLTVEPPAEIASPAGFLIARLAKVPAIIPQARGKRRSKSTMQEVVDPNAVLLMMSELAEQLRSTGESGFGATPTSLTRPNLADDPPAADVENSPAGHARQARPVFGELLPHG